MKSYNLQIRVRNNHLLTIMRTQGISTAAELSRLSGVHQTVIGQYLNLTTAAVCSGSGRWKPSLVKLADALNVTPDMLIPPQHRTTPLEKSQGEVEVSLGEIQSLTGGMLEIGEASPFDNVLRSQQEVCLAEMLYGLTEREETVIRLRFGFDGHAQTYVQIARHFRLSVERIRQIERKALRKLRQKSHRGASAARIQELFGYTPLEEDHSGDVIQRLPMH